MGMPLLFMRTSSPVEVLPLLCVTRHYSGRQMRPDPGFVRLFPSAGKLSQCDPMLNRYWAIV